MPPFVEHPRARRGNGPRGRGGDRQNGEGGGGAAAQTRPTGRGGGDGRPSPAAPPRRRARGARGKAAESRAMTLFGEIDWSMIGDVGCAGGRWVINGKPVQVVTDGYDIIWGAPICCPFFARDPGLVSFLRETQWSDNRGPWGRACVSVEWQVCVRKRPQTAYRDNHAFARATHVHTQVRLEEEDTVQKNQKETKNTDMPTICMYSNEKEIAGQGNRHSSSLV